MWFMKAKIIPLLCIFILFGCQKNDIDVFNGKDTSFEKLKGKWVIVNYWADWCAPCIKELPELFEFAEENNEVLVYVFNFDELDAEDLAPVAQRFNLKLPSLISHPREIWGIETPPAVPATFFINPEGVVVESLFRPQTKDTLNNVLASIK
jgi:thiol-disulfide isomerase/thioredoxin